MVINESNSAPYQVDQKPRKHFKLPIRAAAFLFALIIAGSTCFFGFVQPVFASQLEADVSYSVLLPDDLTPPSSLTSYNGEFFFGSAQSSLLIVTPYRYDFDGSVLNGIYFDVDGSPVQIYDWDSGVTASSYRCFAFSNLKLVAGDYSILFADSFNFGIDFTFKDDISFSGITYRFGPFRLYKDVTSDSFWGATGAPFAVLLSYNSYDSTTVTAYYNGWHTGQTIYATNGVAPYDYNSYLFLKNNMYVPTFIDRLTSGFTAVIGWLGDFFTSLFTGNLVLAFVLVSVGFGLALLSFGWRWVRRFLWGY